MKYRIVKDVRLNTYEPNVDVVFYPQYKSLLFWNYFTFYYLHHCEYKCFEIEQEALDFIEKVEKCQHTYSKVIADSKKNKAKFWI